MRSTAELTHEYRSDTLDLTHSGYFVIVDEFSRVVFSCGDIEDFVFYRSSAKPIQALPTIALGLDKKYGLTDEESAIFAASHMGEDFHIAALERIAQKTGISEDMFLMKPSSPISFRSNEKRINAGLPRRKFYHNCSGKHAALILTQRELGGAPEDYWKIGARVQNVVEQAIKTLSETEEIRLGVDGCGVPVFAVGMKHIAIAFKNLACTDKIGDEDMERAAVSFIPRMNRYPHMISGTDKLCTMLNEDENIVAKGGANGVYGLGLKQQRMGLAFKVADGSEKAWPLLALEALSAIGALKEETRTRIESLHPYIIRNDNGEEVGRRALAFKIDI